MHKAAASLPHSRSLFLPAPAVSTVANCSMVSKPAPAPFFLQDLEEYNPADMVQSLCRMISYNIGQLAYLNAKR